MKKEEKKSAKEDKAKETTGSDEKRVKLRKTEGYIIMTKKGENGQNILVKMKSNR